MREASKYCQQADWSRDKDNLVSGAKEKIRQARHLLSQSASPQSSVLSQSASPQSRDSLKRERVLALVNDAVGMLRELPPTAQHQLDSAWDCFPELKDILTELDDAYASSSKLRLEAEVQQIFGRRVEDPAGAVVPTEQQGDQHQEERAVCEQIPDVPEEGGAEAEVVVTEQQGHHHEAQGKIANEDAEDAEQMALGHQHEAQDQTANEESAPKPENGDEVAAVEEPAVPEQRRLVAGSGGIDIEAEQESTVVEKEKMKRPVYPTLQIGEHVAAGVRASPFPRTSCLRKE